MTLAGGVKGHKNGPLKDAQFSFPARLLFEHSSNALFVCDPGNKEIRRIDLQVGYVQTFCRGGEYRGIAKYHQESLFFVTDSSSHTIKKITATGVVSIFAGSKQDFADGVGTNASFNTPTGICIDQQNGDIFVCDQQNNAIRKITQKGQISTVAKTRSHPRDVCFSQNDECLYFSADGIYRLRLKIGAMDACVAKSTHPEGLAVESDGSLLVSDGDHRIRRINRFNKGGGITVSTLAGRT